MAVWNLIKGKWGNPRTSVAPIRTDASTHSLQTVTYEHHEIHGGSHFFAEHGFDLSAADYMDVIITTPDTTKWSHITYELECEDETLWMIYEGGTVLTAGTTVTAINNNRNSSKTAGTTVTYVQGENEATTATYTSTASATRLALGTVASFKAGGNTTRDHEIVLKQNETYVFRAIATSAGWVSFNAEWYEHTDKD